MKILIVEDELALQDGIREFLVSENFLVEVASTYQQASEKMLNYTYDCILLDIMLPGGSGLDILEMMREAEHKSPVLILSAKDSVEDKVIGLSIGADDYLSKPFHYAELLARLKSIIRRNSQSGNSLLNYKNVSLNPDNREVFINGNILVLNRKEYDMLYYFMLRPQKLLEKTTLAETIWGDHADQADNLDFIYSQIKNLRKKLKQSQAEPDIQAVYGVGYKFV